MTIVDEAKRLEVLIGVEGLHEHDLTSIRSFLCFHLQYFVKLHEAFGLGHDVVSFNLEKHMEYEKLVL